MALETQQLERIRLGHLSVKILTQGWVIVLDIGTLATATLCWEPNLVSLALPPMIVFLLVTVRFLE